MTTYKFVQPRSSFRCDGYRRWEMYKLGIAQAFQMAVSSIVACSPVCVGLTLRPSM